MNGGLGGRGGGGEEGGGRGEGEEVVKGISYVLPFECVQHVLQFLFHFLFTFTRIK